MSTPLISIIIRCFNEEEHIGRLLKGIYAQSLKNFEVILVDSGSTDSTLSVASRFPVTIQSISPDDFSFGRALNVGCARAKGEFMVFASAHVYPSRRGWLEHLIAPFQDPQVALTYGKQRGNEATKFSEHQIFAKWFPEHSVPVQRTPFCNNANAAIRSSCWEKIPYNEEVTGLEDLEWAKRAISRGYYLSYVAEAEVIHVHNERYRSIYNRYYRESIVMHHLFPEQKFHFWNFCYLWLLNTMSDYMHAVREATFIKYSLQIPLFRLMQFFGTYRGYGQTSAVSAELRKRFYYPSGVKSRNISRPAAPGPADEHIDYSAHQHGGDHEHHH